MRFILYVAFLLHSAPVILAAQGVPRVEEEVRRAARQYLDARLANDTASIRRLLADDFISINSNGALGDRASAMRVPLNVTPNGDQIQGFELDSLAVRVYGTTAIITGARRVRIADSLYAGVRFMSVYVRRDDRWLLAATHATDILPRRPR
jgi:ketosteroid isomerase-like protein